MTEERRRGKYLFGNLYIQQYITHTVCEMSVRTKVPVDSDFDVPYLGIITSSVMLNSLLLSTLE